jgi:uncharacterized protein YndB with AHSA1/START domain
MAVHERSREVSAPADAVWRVWSDAASWPQWNPDVSAMELSGPFGEGAEGRMTTKSSGNRAHPVRLVDVEPGRRFALQIKPVPGATFTFTCRIEDAGPGRSRISQAVTMRGPMAPLFSAMMGNRIAQGFEPILAALAARVESPAVS